MKNSLMSQILTHRLIVVISVCFLLFLKSYINKPIIKIVVIGGVREDG